MLHSEAIKIDILLVCPSLRLGYFFILLFSLKRLQKYQKNLCRSACKQLCIKNWKYICEKYYNKLNYEAYSRFFYPFVKIDV